MKFTAWILSIFSGFFALLFALFAFLPSLKFTRKQREKYSFIKRLDGKQLYFLGIFLLFGALAFVFNAGKDYIAMQFPADPGAVHNKELAESLIKSTTNSKQVFASNSINASKDNSNIAIPNLPAPATVSKRKLDNTSKTPTSMHQSLAKARGLYKQGKYNASIAECDKILHINPNNSDALALKRMAQKQNDILSP